MLWMLVNFLAIAWRCMTQYQVGGSLRHDHPSYVRRRADADLYQALRQGEFCYVFNARQMGKSSLMVQVLHQLQQDGMRCGAIDLSRIGSERVTPEQWYKGFAVELWQAFELFQRVNLPQWWRDRADLSPVQRLSQLIEAVLLVEVSSPTQPQPRLVVFLDEVDSLRQLDFPLDDFFGLIRTCYNRRSLQVEYQRLTFVCLGVTTPAELMRDPLSTPFNIGRSIDLSDLHQADLHPLAQGLVGYVHDPGEAVQAILHWTGGQPFLMQKICQLLVQHPISTRSLTDEDHIQHLIQDWMLQSWEFQDEPEHFRTIRDRLLHHTQAIQLLEIYHHILTLGAVAFNGSREHIELLLTGLVINQTGQLVVKNPIYQTLFNLNWVRDHLTQLRPYAPLLDAWLRSGQTDESRLLRGQTLQDALIWALGKNLGQGDYQFLVASQALAQREALTTLAAVEQAQHLLATARHQARQSVQKLRLGWRWLPGITLSSTLFILLVRSWGSLQGLELNGYDQFMQWRPLEPPDHRIVLVAIDEQDIQQVGHPIPDQVLAQAIQIIQAQTPRVIGLDIYRDLPIEPGHQALNQIFATAPNLYGIEKVAGNPVAPPPVLQQQQQVGFADQVEDSDGKVRRALLSLGPAANPRYSLAVKLALSYLAAEGLTLKELDADGQRVELGRARFQQLAPQDGGYVNAPTGQSYQILLNFRGTDAHFTTVSLRQVLNREIAPDQFRDRVVLIGYIAASIDDRFWTPYHGGWFNAPPPISGVTLHANIVSQILSAALDGRPLLQPISPVGGWLWLLLWSGVGAAIAWWWRSPLKVLLLLGCASSGLISSSYGAFLLGWWIPVIPPLLGLWTAAIALLIVAARQRDRRRLHHTLTQLLAAQPDYPVATRIAIEYLRQSEPKEHQAVIDRGLEPGGR